MNRTGRAALRTVVAMVGLFVLASGVDLTLGIVQATLPSVYKDCPDETDALIGRPRESDIVGCTVTRWRDRADSVAWKTPVDVTVREDGDSLVTTFRLTVPKDDPLVRAAQAGELSASSDTSAFLQLAYVSPFTVNSWRGPFVAVRDGSDEATVSVVNTEKPPFFAERRLFAVNGGALSVDLDHTRIVFVTGAGEVIEQSATTLRTRLPEGKRGRSVTLAIRSDSGTPAVISVADLDGWTIVLGDVVWPSLIGALPWVFFLVLQRRRTELWRRFRWLLTTLLVAHTVLVGVTVLTRVEQPLADRLRSWVGGEPELAGSPTVPGASVLLLCCLGFLATYAVHWYRQRVSGSLRGEFWMVWIMVVAPILCLVAIGVYAWALADRTFDKPFTTAVLAWLGTSLLVVLLAVPVLRRRTGVALGVVLTGVPLAVLASLHDRVGALPSAVRIAVPLVFACTAAVSLGCLAVSALGKPPPRWVWWVLGMLAVAVSVRLPIGDTAWFNLTEFASGLDSLLATTAAVLLAVVLYRAEKDNGRRSSPAQWRLGLACAFVVLAGAFSFTARPSFVFLVAAAGAAWWLLPRRQRDVAVRLERLTAANRRSAVGALVASGEARRLLAPLRKSMRDKASAGDVEFPAMSARVGTVERAAVKRRETIDGLTLEERALGLPARSTSSRLGWGALTGAVVGLPWTAIALYGATSTAPPGRGYPVLGVLTDIGPQLLCWAAYGVVFAYFFPLLRGRTGLAKALCLFVAVAVPTIVDTIPNGVGAAGWQTVTLTVLQALSFAMSLGLLADRDVLLAHGYEGSRLADLHNLGTFAAWASSIAVSLGTAVATALLVGLQRVYPMIGVSGVVDQ